MQDKNGETMTIDVLLKKAKDLEHYDLMLESGEVQKVATRVPLKKRESKAYSFESRFLKVK